MTDGPLLYTQPSQRSRVLLASLFDRASPWVWVIELHELVGRLQHSERIAQHQSFGNRARIEVDRGDKRAYLSSCHSQALRGIAGVTHQQRAEYCATELKNAERYNPQHKNVHGFVGAYSVSGAGQTSSATPSATARAKPASRGAVAIPKGIQGSARSSQALPKHNPTQGPSNISGAPRGLAWFPATSTNGRGQVTGNSMYADASPSFSASDQIARRGSDQDAEDNGQPVDHPERAVLTRAALRRMLGSPDEVITASRSSTRRHPGDRSRRELIDKPEVAQLSQTASGTDRAPFGVGSRWPRRGR